ncbi:MAG: ATP-binding cassette domain-containing protein [Gemmatimonadota bacterium]|jgi:ABC-type polar amino acid transport system ATPase subunit|nr:ATP-binding cassette domain-containing protein [Gemmatimonadota bacterium]MDQ8168853.1 ATP-binding cassette domain-containing protein [Gemmatimonadota bacterium]MDQ8173798.1 ATP-binding cassette domain-containing protein [Gemmatimonadota bacterium]
MSHGGTSTLRIRALQAVRGTQPVLHGVDLDVAAGEVCALMGVSGAGKSTVLRVIAALQPFSAGTVAIGDVHLAPGPLPPESRLRTLRRRVGVVFQSHALFEHLTALENVMLAPVHALGVSRADALATATRLLDSLGVATRANAYPKQLSGGEAQRVAIARALAPDPQLLLMDEPTSALDPARRTALAESLRALAAQGRGLLVVTHDVDFARAVADTVVELSQGAMARRGPASQLLPTP